MKANFSPFKIMNGIHLYDAFIAGTRRVLEKEQQLNRINVFPVPDGDTGSNLAATLKHILEDTTPEKSFRNTLHSISQSALEGARGNSGIIFAQFLYGLAQRARNVASINVPDFVHLVRGGVESAVLAIENPVEGTIISVIRDWADHLEKIKGKMDDFLRLLSTSIKTAQTALRKTPEKLAILKKNNVVDAGAQGFVFFLEGVTDFLKKGLVKRDFKQTRQKVEPIKEEASAEMSKYRYCSESIIEGKELEAGTLRGKLSSLGDSLVIAGGGDRLRVHIHTNRPGDFFYYLQTLGTLRDQKVDDMFKQQEIRNNRKWPIALVTDSVCDLPGDVMDRYQIHAAPIRVHFGDNTFFDKITLTPDRFYQLLQEREEHPSTSHPGIKDFEALYSFLLQHYDSVIALHMSKQLSGTWNASRQVAERLGVDYGKKITVIDSRQLSGSLGLMVLRAAQAIEAGLGHEEVVSKIGEWQKKADILVSVKTLKYMVKGGRVSPMKGKVANLLNLTPIISLDGEGKSVLYDKAFSQKGNIKKVLKIIRRKTRNARVWKYSILHAHDPGGVRWFSDRLTELLDAPPDFIIDISPAVGLNAGHGALAVALMTE